MRVDPGKVKSFRTEAAFAAWMRANHGRETEVWLKIHKNHRARRPRSLLDEKLPVRLSSQHPGGSGRLLFGDAAANP